MNRYGRHGTRAWLRRHLRQRQQRIATSLVAAKTFIPVVVFNITVPAGVGKVVIIVTEPSGNTSNTSIEFPNPQTVDQSMNSQIMHPTHVDQNVERDTDRIPQFSLQERKLVEIAEFEADEDLNEIKRKRLNGIQIWINWPKLEARMDQLASSEVRRDTYRESNPGQGGLIRLKDIYKDAYTIYFKKGIHQNPDGISLVPTEQEREVRKAAKKERERHPERDTKTVAIIAVASVLSTLSILSDQAENNIDTISPLVDIYRTHYENPKDEEEWPSSQEIFQGNGRH